MLTGGATGAKEKAFKPSERTTNDADRTIARRLRDRRNTFRANKKNRKFVKCGQKLIYDY